MAELLRQATETILDRMGRKPGTVEQQLLVGKMMLSGDIGEAKIHIHDQIRTIINEGARPLEKLKRISDIMRLIENSQFLGKPAVRSTQVYTRTSVIPFLKAMSTEDYESAAKELIANKTAMAYWKKLEKMAVFERPVFKTVMQQRKMVNEALEKLKEEGAKIQNKPSLVKVRGNEARIPGTNIRPEVLNDALELIRNHTERADLTLDQRLQEIAAVLAVFRMPKADEKQKGEGFFIKKRPVVFSIIGKDPQKIAEMIASEKRGVLSAYFKKLMDTIEEKREGGAIPRPKKYIDILYELEKKALKSGQSTITATNFDSRVERVREFLKANP